MMFTLGANLFVILYTVALGALSGYLAGRIMGCSFSKGKMIALGILGSVVGNLLFGIIGLKASGFIGHIIISVAGGCFCIWLSRKFDQ